MPRQCGERPLSALHVHDTGIDASGPELPFHLRRTCLGRSRKPRTFTSCGGLHCSLRARKPGARRLSALSPRYLPRDAARLARDQRGRCYAHAVDGTVSSPCVSKSNAETAVLIERNAHGRHRGSEAADESGCRYSRHRQTSRGLQDRSRRPRHLTDGRVVVDRKDCRWTLGQFIRVSGLDRPLVDAEAVPDDQVGSTAAPASSIACR